MDYRIAPIAEEHIEGFHAAVDSVARERRYLAFLAAPSLEKTREFVRENLRLNSPAFVALHGGGVVGWCDITSLNRPVFAHAGVLGMGVLVQYRGQGMGPALLRAALDAAKARGLMRVELTVRAGNQRARTLYEKFGFVMEGVKKNAVRVDGCYEDLYCMAVLFDRPGSVA